MICNYLHSERDDINLYNTYETGFFSYPRDNPTYPWIPTHPVSGTWGYPDIHNPDYDFFIYNFYFNKRLYCLFSIQQK